MNQNVSPMRQATDDLKRRLLAQSEHISRVWPSAVRDGTVLRFIDAVVTCCRQSPSLFKDPTGVIREAMVAARLGLEPAPALHHCAIVPFGGKGGIKATLIVEYQGMAHILWRHNEILIDAEAVYEHDQFAYAETAEGTRMEWTPSSRDDRGKLVGAWARLRYKDGRCRVRYVTGARIRAIAAAQIAKGKRAGKPSPWEDPVAEPEMWAKTAVRAAFKLAPKDSPVVQELARALDHEDNPEELREADIEIVPDDDLHHEPETTLDRAAADLEARGRGASPGPEPAPPDTEETAERGPGDDAAEPPPPDKWSATDAIVAAGDRPGMVRLCSGFGRALPGLHWDEALAAQGWADDVEFSRQPTKKLQAFLRTCIAAARKVGV